MSNRFTQLARSLYAGLLVAQALAHTVALADEKPDLKPLLGERGEVIFAVDFNGPDAKPFPVAAAAEPTVVDGHLSLKQGGLSPAGFGAVEKSKIRVPAKYALPSSSGIEVKVDAKNRNVSLDLKP